MPTLSVLIVSYQVRERLEACLASVAAAAAGHDWEILVVDNASSDGTGPMVRDRFPVVQFIALPENVGYGRANNIGIRKCQSPYVLLLNPDTVIEPDVIPALLPILESDPRIGGITCKVLLEDGKLDAACRRSFPRPVDLLYKQLGLSRLFPRSPVFNHYNLGYLPENEAADVECVMGAFFLIKRDVLVQVGTFDEQFFLYGEDLDLCRRIGQAGWRLRYEPKVAIRHIKGSSAAKNPQVAIREFHRSWRILFDKHWLPTASNWERWLVYKAIDLHERWNQSRYRRKGGKPFA